jgi:hypothetical protein
MMPLLPRCPVGAIVISLCSPPLTPSIYPPVFLACCRYIPVLMGMAKIYWDRENYPMVEKVFRQSAEFCSEHDVWKLNVAHVFFMQVGVPLGCLRCPVGTLSPCVPLTRTGPNVCSPTLSSTHAHTHSRAHPPSALLPGQESKFLESIRYYEPIVKKHSDNILEVTAGAHATN